MNAPAADAYRPHTLDEFPGLTPEEIGRRFLKLIDSLKSFNDLSLERIHDKAQLHMQIQTVLPDSEFYSFEMHLPESGWHYRVDYYNDTVGDLDSLGYIFKNESEHADVTPVCGMDFNAYVTRLKGMGFKEEPATYYSRSNYSRNNVMVQIFERKGTDAPTKEHHHACIESINVRKLEI